MFLEIIRNANTGEYVSHKLVTKEDITKKHSYHMDLRGWTYAPRMGSRFGFSNYRGRYMYVRTDERDQPSLEAMARKLCL
jgi:hypothetical protein